MSDNIRTRIDELKKDGRASGETKNQANRLSKYIGSNKPIPVGLKKDIRNNPSKSDGVRMMLSYIKNK